MLVNTMITTKIHVPVVLDLWFSTFSQDPHLDQHLSCYGSFWDILENPLNYVNYQWTKISATFTLLVVNSLQITLTFTSK